MIRFALLPDGGFVAGDTETGRTRYAYPTSNTAQSARHIPEYVAQALMLDENRLATDRDGGRALQYDADNWHLILSEGQRSRLDAAGYALANQYVAVTERFRMADEVQA